MERCNLRSLQRAPGVTPPCTTVTCRTSQMQATEKTSYNFCICPCASTVLATCTSWKKASRRVLQREEPLCQVGLKDKKIAISILVCYCAGEGRGYLQRHWCRYSGLKTNNKTRPASGRGVPDAEECDWHKNKFVLDFILVVQPGRNRQLGSLFKYLN